MLTMNDVIDEQVIEACELEGACREGLTFLLEAPRTIQELRDRSLNWLAWMASHKNYPPVLELLAKDADVDVRGGVAQNAQTPTPVLELLAKDADVDVRMHVAQNAQTPTAVLELLAKDADAYVRFPAERALKRLRG